LWENTGSPDAKSPVVISLQNVVALLSSGGFSSSVAAFSGCQNFVSAFWYLITAYSPVTKKPWNTLLAIGFLIFMGWFWGVTEVFRELEGEVLEIFPQLMERS